MHYFFLLLIFTFYSCQSNQKLNNSEDSSKEEIIKLQEPQNDQVMKDLNKEEIVKLYETHSGQPIRDHNHFCTKKAKHLDGVYALGWFAHDRGCMGDEILLDQKIGLRKELTAQALALNGWKDKDKQQNLALYWTTEVILVWASALTTSDEDFEKEGSPSFEAPKSIPHNKGWRVTTWVRQASGMLPQTSYYQLQVDFDASGNEIQQKKINSFVIKLF